MEKKCFKCFAIKPLSEFYKHGAMADRHLNKCKECTKKDSRQHRESNLEKVREYDRNRPNAKERVEKHLRRMKRIMIEEPEKFKQVRMQCHNWRRNNKGKSSAHCKLARAIRIGKITKPNQCERCDSTEHIHGHHEDYSKPLDVVWLCPDCHGKRHAEIRNEARKNKNSRGIK